ncbi:succinate dehydrogenase assembly factor 2 [Methylophilaceae bacterium]|jgi:antitoxin CptB|nr:succinate dehydrogenase assembly factor 2 [Methylophilaceae bacterium]|tara:strand:+ start:584 stop:826 length:243 start_codon:yes stop_codon:yes gene_type:complete
MNLDNLIKYRCRRGMLELDLILNKFCEQHLFKLSLAKKKLFLELLENDDKDVWQILGSTYDKKKYKPLVNLIEFYKLKGI